MLLVFQFIILSFINLQKQYQMYEKKKMDMGKYVDKMVFCRPDEK